MIDDYLYTQQLQKEIIDDDLRYGALRTEEEDWESAAEAALRARVEREADSGLDGLF